VKSAWKKGGIRFAAAATAADNIITANERIEIGLRTPRAMDFPAGMAQKESARSSCFASIRGFFSLPARNFVWRSEPCP
jgi:hypothetical protein